MSTGGKREGAGRKPVPYETKMMRVPLPCVNKVERVIADFKKKALRAKYIIKERNEDAAHEML